MPKRRTWVATIVLLGLAIGLFGLARRSARGFTPKFGVGFHGYTNGNMGKRWAIVSITNLGLGAVRLGPALKVDYGPSLNGPISRRYLQNLVLHPQDSLNEVVEVSKDAEQSQARWRLVLRASQVTTSERLVHWWDGWTKKHPWSWVLPFPFDTQPEGSFTSDWLGPQIADAARRHREGKTDHDLEGTKGLSVP